MKVVTEFLDPLVIAGLFGLARLVARASGSVARRLLVWHDGRHPERGFTIQRVPADVIAGLAMFVECWYAVGDTIFIASPDLQGVGGLTLRRSNRVDAAWVPHGRLAR